MFNWLEITEKCVAFDRQFDENILKEFKLIPKMWKVLKNSYNNRNDGKLVSRMAENRKSKFSKGRKIQKDSLCPRKVNF